MPDASARIGAEDRERAVAFPVTHFNQAGEFLRELVLPDMAIRNRRNGYVGSIVEAGMTIVELPPAHRARRWWTFNQNRKADGS